MKGSPNSGPLVYRAVSKARPCIVLIIVGLAFGSLALIPNSVYGQDGSFQIEGRVVNATKGANPTDGLEVTLHVIDDLGAVNVSTAITDGDGRFQFKDIELNSDSTYAVATSYQDVLYSARVESSSPMVPVELLVYETTNDIETIHVESDVLLLSNEGGNEERISAIELIRLVNLGDRTFMPNLTQPAQMNFLRFSLPPGASDLDVSSDLPGGEIISIGTGFALTAPVTPGSHQVTYAYRIPYEGTAINLRRSFPMGADSFRLLLEEGSADLRNPVDLIPLEALFLEGRSLDVWGAADLSPGDSLTMEIGGLPRPSSLNRLGDALADGPYLKIGIPAAVGLVMAAVLLYVLLFKQPERTPSANSELALAASYPVAGAPHPPDSLMEDQRRSLIEAIAALDNELHRGELDFQEYEIRRTQLKARLVQLVLASKPD